MLSLYTATQIDYQSETASAITKQKRCLLWHVRYNTKWNEKWTMYMYTDTDLLHTCTKEFTCTCTCTKNFDKKQIQLTFTKLQSSCITLAFNLKKRQEHFKTDHRQVQNFTFTLFRGQFIRWSDPCRIKSFHIIRTTAFQNQTIVSKSDRTVRYCSKLDGELPMTWPHKEIVI